MSANERCLNASCKRCQMESYLQSGGFETEEIKPNYREKPVTSINRSYASDVAGLDFEQLKLFCSILDHQILTIPYIRE